MAELTQLAPREVWAEFEAITRVPRPSKREEQIRNYLVGWAETHHLECRCDATGNVVIRKAATAGTRIYLTVFILIILELTTSLLCAYIHSHRS